MNDNLKGDYFRAPRLQHLQPELIFSIAWLSAQCHLLLVEDAGLLEGVLALGDVPHSDRPVAAAGGQQALLIGPAARDDLTETGHHGV